MSYLYLKVTGHALLKELLDNAYDWLMSIIQVAAVAAAPSGLVEGTLPYEYK